MKTACKFFGYIALVCGIIASIFLAYMFGVDAYGDRSIWLTLAIFIIFIFMYVPAALVLISLGQILGAVETINYNVFNTKVELDACADDLELLKKNAGISQ
ncbi:MAG: hypothetical protein ACLR7N_13475 [Roseburia hominis]|jgi:hypothetical protein